MQVLNRPLVSGAGAREEYFMLHEDANCRVPEKPCRTAEPSLVIFYTLLHCMWQPIMRVCCAVASLNISPRGRSFQWACSQLNRFCFSLSECEGGGILFLPHMLSIAYYAAGSPGKEDATVIRHTS